MGWTFNVKDARSGINPGLLESAVQYVYDLEVDTATMLHPAEAGIEWLRFLSVGEVKATLDRRELKPSCTCVMIDFVVRHGIINGDSDRDFAEIVSRLHLNDARVTKEIIKAYLRQDWIAA
ncbi:hypothetical protein EDB80DRAFT_877147 [Ilyonectria destructans]|nr:hypothetical protein EDB80DRAFT_877147 [Ilyonectria destructans]